ncbi:Sugar phosphate isomerase/epimerase [Methanolobus vulcani]|jgi:Sugar phosphate isomerases/epimerases|uniref:Sugar phosphate isomerase/epimerase n=1 Tax=Methanolobus vulcani TaxID=38026 RepID=A0A7Z7FC46_9EURY|nr:sugar phosphate isomerase/epimerase family protein [Methanolobus vulcani]SDF53522.1 Sugar phosphate isomerase/epimerase [Methanolobus vulcani]
MILGASSFAGSFSDIASELQSVELYMPKLGVYKDSILQRDILESLLDELSTVDLDTSIHAPYFADVPTYPKDVVVDVASMGEKEFRLIRESIELASRLGSRAIVLHPGRFECGDDHESCFSKMVANLKILASDAEDSGVVLGLENKEGTSTGNMCCDATELVRAVKAVNSENLGATFDIGHANLTCGGDSNKLRQFAKIMAPYVIHVHVHDNGGVWTDEYDGDQHLAPGAGTIDYTVLKELKNRNYKGIFNMEVFSMDDVRTGKATIRKALND